MGLSHRFDRDHLWLSVSAVEGELEEELQFLRDAFSALAADSPVSLVLDLRDASGGRNMSQVRALSEYVLANRHLLRERHVMLVSNDLYFGLARMFSAIAEHKGLIFQVFRDEKKALCWLDRDI